MIIVSHKISLGNAIVVINDEILCNKNLLFSMNPSN